MCDCREQIPEDRARCDSCEAKHNRNVKLPASGRKWLLILAGVLALAAILLWLATNSRTDPQQQPQQQSILRHEMDVNGSKYLSVPDGSVIHLQDPEIYQAVMTADRKHILVWRTDGSIYVTDPEGKEKHTVAEPKSFCFYSYGNDAGFYYKDAKGVCFRVTFAEPKPVRMGQEIDYIPVFAQNSATLLYGAGQAVYVLPANAAKPRKIGTFTGDFAPVAISDDGRLAVWVETQGTTQTLCLYDGKETLPLHRVQDDDTVYSAATVSVTFSKDQKMTVIRCYKSNRMWLKNADADPVEVSFPTNLITFQTPVYTNAGVLEERDAREITCLYIPVEVYAGMHLYRVSMTGDSALLLEDAFVYNYAVIDERVFYCSKNDVLYCAKLSGSTVSEATQIAKDVEQFRVSRDGQYVYYLQTEDQPDKLSCYRVDTAKTYTIAENVAWGMADGTKTLYLSPDGSTVLYFQNKHLVGNTGVWVAALMQWNEQGSTQIAENVVMSSVTSGLRSAVFLPDSISYLQYDAAASARQLCGNRMHFDGKQHRCVIENICLNPKTELPDWISAQIGLDFPSGKDRS